MRPDKQLISVYMPIDLYNDFKSRYPNIATTFIRRCLIRACCDKVFFDDVFFNTRDVYKKDNER